MTSSPLQHLVIVDDSLMVGRIIASSLARHAPNYTTHICTRGAEALSYLAQTHVAAVIIDYTLPDIDGITLARTITTRWPALPIVLFTGLWSPDLDTAARTAGCIAALEKPCGLAELWSTLQSVFLSHNACEAGCEAHSYGLRSSNRSR